MEGRNTKGDTCTITGVFSNQEDAENAYHILMEMDYTPEEITLIMSNETNEKLFKHHTEIVLDAIDGLERVKLFCTISEAVDSLGKFIAIPGVSLVVAGDFSEGGVRALTGSVMSDRYASFYQTRLKEGEIVIDFQPHTFKERNIITSLWENYGGDSMIRRMSAA